jgi:succinate dehydrogenase / fumarate reductase, cytochrome b subunit
MRLGGLLLIGFLIYHILHIYGVGHPDFIPDDVYHNVVTGLRVPWLATLYAMATVLFGMHLYHGLWSLLRTLGLPAGGQWQQQARPGVLALTLLITLGFLAPVVASVTRLLT